MHACRDYLDELGDYLDGALDLRRRAAIEGHLNACPRCQIVFQTTRRTVDLYRRMPPCCVPTEVESRILSSLEQRFGHGRGPAVS
jgi:anti-sigma factor RsiW